MDRLRGESLTATLFPRNILSGEDLSTLQKRLERDYTSHHFRRLGGDTKALARFLGLGPRQFYRRLARLGLSLRKLRGS